LGLGLYLAHYGGLGCLKAPGQPSVFSQTPVRSGDRVDRLVLPPRPPRRSPVHGPARPQQAAALQPSAISASLTPPAGESQNAAEPRKGTPMQNIIIDKPYAFVPPVRGVHPPGSALDFGLCQSRMVKKKLVRGITGAGDGSCRARGPGRRAASDSRTFGLSRRMESAGRGMRVDDGGTESRRASIETEGTRSGRFPVVEAQQSSEPL
jgi:hypothetical protein